jgi:predicted methyltransferase
MDGNGYTIKATVEVEEDILRITSVNPNNGQKATDVQTIRTLEGDHFVIENHKGTMLMMERLRE